MIKSQVLRWLPAIVLVLVLLPAFARQGRAQAALTFKVGDKIECQVTGQWQPGTIVRMQPGGSGEMFYHYFVSFPCTNAADSVPSDA
jgi:hypothetical protein